MPGRRQPTDLVKAKGRKHLSRAEEEARRATEVKTPKEKQIRCPKWLPEDLRPDFLGYARQLTALGIFCKLDRDTLGRYLVAHESWLLASGKAMRYLKAGNSEAAAEWGAIQDKYFKQARACAEDLGLTISARCKLVVPQVEQEEDDFALFALPKVDVG